MPEFVFNTANTSAEIAQSASSFTLQQADGRKIKSTALLQREGGCHLVQW